MATAEEAEGPAEEEGMAVATSAAAGLAAAAGAAAAVVAAASEGAEEAATVGMAVAAAAAGAAVVEDLDTDSARCRRPRRPGRTCTSGTHNCGSASFPLGTTRCRP